MVRTSGTSPVCLVHLVDLVCFVYLVDLVHLVCLMQPNTPDRPNRPNEQDRRADFSSILPERRWCDTEILATGCHALSMARPVYRMAWLGIRCDGRDDLRDCPPPGAA